MAYLDEVRNQYEQQQTVVASLEQSEEIMSEVYRNFNLRIYDNMTPYERDIMFDAYHSLAITLTQARSTMYALESIVRLLNNGDA